MHKFTDDRGRDWTLRLTITEAKRVRDELGLSLIADEDLRKATGDLETTADVLHCLCRQQAEERGIDPGQFGELLTECFAAAADALLDELAAFFRKLGKTALATLAERIQTASRTMETRATELLASDRVDEAIDQAIRQAEQELDRFAGKRSTSGQESPAAPTPAR